MQPQILRPLLKSSPAPYICRSCLRNCQSAVRPSWAAPFATSARHGLRQNPRQRKTPVLLDREEPRLPPNAPIVEEETLDDEGEPNEDELEEWDPDEEVEVDEGSDEAKIMDFFRENEDRPDQVFKEFEKSTDIDFSNPEIQNVLMRGSSEEIDKLAESLPSLTQGVFARKTAQAQLPKRTSDAAATDDMSRFLEDELPGEYLFRSIPVKSFPEDRRPYITKLNTLVQMAQKGSIGAKTVGDLWRFYSLCSTTLSAAWHKIPLSYWQTLWKAFADGPVVPGRLLHVKLLAEDMRAAGIALEPRQLLLYIEALFMEGDRKEAIKAWESYPSSSHITDDEYREYLETGVRMYARTSQPERAQEVADKVSNSSLRGKDPRILLSVLHAWLVSDREDSAGRAWKCYEKMRHLLGSEIEMKDYDDTIELFLAGNRADLALAAFRDMMTQGKRVEGVDIFPDGLASELAPEDIKIKSVPFRNLSMLPAKLRNKFFFGMWIKKLIGDGKVDACAQVVDLMVQGGIRPDAKHLNGIIGAWLREGTVGSQEKAETMAWKMIACSIERRPKLMSQSRLGNFPKSIPQPEKSGVMRPQELTLYAEATMETYVVLGEYYMEHSRWPELRGILDLVKSRKIKPSAALMNLHLRFMLRGHTAPSAWPTYQSYYMKQFHLRPDPETFVYFWGHEQARLRQEARVKDLFPEPRALFRHMLEMLPPGHDEPEAMQEIYERTISSFGLADDQIATIVALRVFQQHYGIYPTGDTVRLVILQLANVGRIDPTGVRARRPNWSGSTKQRVRQVTQILADLKNQRAALLQKKELVSEEADEQAKSEEVLVLLELLLNACYHLKKQHTGEPNGWLLGNIHSIGDIALDHDEIGEVAHEMGIGALLQDEEES